MSTAPTQNGKGSAPRNLGQKFRKNYGSIFRKKKMTERKMQEAIKNGAFDSLGKEAIEDFENGRCTKTFE